MSSSAPFSITINPATSAPSWWANDSTFPVGTWKEVAEPIAYGIRTVWHGSGDIDAITRSWNTAVVNQQGKEMILNCLGGHNNYLYNEGYAVCLGEETPRWRRLTEPTPQAYWVGASATNTLGSCQHLDGRRRAPHSWGQHIMCDDGKIWYPSGHAYHAGVTGSSEIMSFNRYYSGPEGTIPLPGQDGSPLPWVNSPGPWYTTNTLGIPSLSEYDGRYQASPCTYDPVTRVIFSTCDYTGSTTMTHYAWSFSIDAPTVVTQYPKIATYNNAGSAPAVTVADRSNPGTNCAVFSNSPSGLRVFRFSNLAGGWSAKTLTTAAGGASVSLEDAGCVYHSASNALFLWNDSAKRIYKMSVPTDPWSGTFAWQVPIDPVSGATPSAAEPNTTLQRFNIIEDMGDGRSAIVLFNDIDHPVYVFKIPAGGM